MSTYYHRLNVSREANPEEIKKAYRREALRWHPDKNPDKIKEAEERFKKIVTAYETLSNPEKRREYDKGLDDLSDNNSEDFNRTYPDIDPNLNEDKFIQFLKQITEILENAHKIGDQLVREASGGDWRNLKRYLIPHCSLRVSFQGYTVVDYAVMQQRLDILKDLLAYRGIFGADLNRKNIDQDTVLHIAVQNQYVEIIQILVENKAEITWRDQNEDIPLHIAITKSHTQKSPEEKLFTLIAIYLIKAGRVEGSLFWKKHSNEVENKEGETPLYLALNNKNYSIVEELLNQKVEVDVKAYEFAQKRMYFSECWESLLKKIVSKHEEQLELQSCRIF